MSKKDQTCKIQLCWGVHNFLYLFLYTCVFLNYYLSRLFMYYYFAYFLLFWGEEA